MIRPLFSWFAGRRSNADDPAATESPDGRAILGTLTGDSAVSGSETRRDAPQSTASQLPIDAPGTMGSGRAAGRREVEALESLRTTRFTNREEASLHAQLARAPRDINALFGLLAFHARRGDAAQTATYAHALWDETDAEGGLWQRAAGLGRAVDPDNPLYSSDPFAALAEHAATQPVQRVLPLSHLDLSFLDTVASSPEPLSVASDDAPLNDRGREMPAEKSVFDFLHAAPSHDRLPASFAGLDMGLDDDDANLDDAQRDAVLVSLLGGSAPHAATASGHDRDALARVQRLGDEDLTAAHEDHAATTRTVLSDGAMKYRPVRGARGRKKSRK